jgi:alpha-1,3-glucan synthase
MLSQLTKTIKLALKSTEKERAILRARSAVQRFPVVEWRQRMEDIHRRSINTSRSVAGANAWRSSDGGEKRIQPLADIEDWSPEALAHPTQPEWDGRSALDVPSPSSPDQWSQDTLRPRDPGVRQSYASDDYFARSRNASTTDLRDNSYHGFLEKANKVIASDHKHAPDPFLDGNPAPSRPFGAHSRVSSVESISSIVDEKSNSPLNKAITSVSRHMLNFPFMQLKISKSVYGCRRRCRCRICSEVTSTRRKKFAT